MTAWRLDPSAPRFAEDDPLHYFFARAKAEAFRARGLFPTNEHRLAAMSEEAGEVAKAMLDHSYGKGQAADVFREAVQLAAMAARLAVEGDASFPYTWREATS